MRYRVLYRVTNYHATNVDATSEERATEMVINEFYDYAGYGDEIH